MVVTHSWPDPPGRVAMVVVSESACGGDLGHDPGTAVMGDRGHPGGEPASLYLCDHALVDHCAGRGEERTLSPTAGRACFGVRCELFHPGTAGGRRTSAGLCPRKKIRPLLHQGSGVGVAG